MSYSPDGRQLACSYYSGYVRIWDIETGCSNRAQRGKIEKLKIVSYSPDDISI